MDQQQALNQTIEVFRKVFGKDVKVDVHTTADDIEKWDSLNHIILIQELEKKFGIKFDLFEIIGIRDVSGLVSYILSKT